MTGLFDISMMVLVSLGIMLLSYVLSFLEKEFIVHVYMIAPISAATVTTWLATYLFGWEWRGGYGADDISCLIVTAISLIFFSVLMYWFVRRRFS